MPYSLNSYLKDLLQQTIRPHRCSEEVFLDIKIGQIMNKLKIVAVMQQ